MRFLWPGLNCSLPYPIGNQSCPNPNSLSSPYLLQINSSSGVGAVWNTGNWGPNVVVHFLYQPNLYKEREDSPWGKGGSFDRSTEEGRKVATGGKKRDGTPYRLAFELKWNCIFPRVNQTTLYRQQILILPYPLTNYVEDSLRLPQMPFLISGTNYVSAELPQISKEVWLSIKRSQLRKTTKVNTTRWRMGFVIKDERWNNLLMDIRVKKSERRYDSRIYSPEV